MPTPSTLSSTSPESRPSSWRDLEGLKRELTRYSENPEARLVGGDWPETAETMIGVQRLDNIEYCIWDVVDENVSGDLVECGVWRGGACIFMRACLMAIGVTNRKVWCCDSFEGCPTPDTANYPADENDPHHTFEFLAVPLEEVRANFKRYGLLDEQVGFVPGWFKHTLPGPIERIAVLRLDGDMYESTWQSLTALYPLLSEGGYCIIDDYGIPSGCKRAVHDYLEREGLKVAMRPLSSGAVFWRKTC